MKNTAHALSSARRVLDALRLVSEVGSPASVRLAHTAAHTAAAHSAASPRYDIQPSLRLGVGVLTWLLQSNLSVAERRALARELDPVLAHTQPVSTPVTQPAPPKVHPVLSPPKAQPVPLQQRQEQELAVPAAAAARAVEHPVLGTLLYDFGYKRVNPPARPCAAPAQD